MIALDIHSHIAFHTSETYEDFDVKNQPIWVIGDVHGCDDQFLEVLEKIISEDEDAIIYQLGDMIDRGPGMLEAYQLAKDFYVNLLLGNHEMNFLAEHYGLKNCNSKHRKNSHILFASYNQEDKDFILEMMNKSIASKLIRMDKENQTFFYLTHAPRSLNAEQANYNGWSFCKSNNPVDEQEYLELFNLTDIDYYNVHGHQHWNYTSIEDQISRGLRGLNIDGGAAYGKELVALRLNDFKSIRVSNPIDFS